MIERVCAPARFRWLWLGLLISSLVVVGSLASGSTAGNGGLSVTPAPTPPTAWQIPAAMTLADEPGAEPLSSGDPKLASSLSQLLAAHRRDSLSGASSFASRHMIALDQGRVQVVVVAVDEALDGLQSAVQAFGGEVQAHHGTLLQALVPIDALQLLAARSDVLLVREPRRPIPDAPSRAGVQTTEGVAASNASAWHASGWDGTGVRLAIIDSGFTGYAALLGTDLPASVGVHDWTGEGLAGTEHGTACAEIAYDMAPGVTMDLHKVGTEVELANAVDQAIADGADVASMSMSWALNGPGDGTGSMADIVADARANGIFFAKSAGNYAESSWSGTYANYHTGTDDFNAWDGASQWFNFIGPGGGSCWILPPGVPIVGALHWDDWAAVDQDYDLILFRWPGTGTTLYKVASATDPQNGGAGQTPEELLNYVAAGVNCYAFAVERVNATRNVCLRLTNYTAVGHLDRWTPQRTLGFPADSPDAVTVAAVDVAGYALEPYSSQGPTFGSGGACSGGAIKPDIAGYANVSTVSYGPGVFNGTSAATPHVAGAAALVKELHPAYTVSQLQGYLEAQAIDLGAPGKDDLYGAGRLYLPPLVENSPPNTPGSPSPADGVTGVSASADLSWTGGDPDPGDTVTYDVRFGTSDPPAALLCNDVPGTTCDPGALSQGTHYYWYVVATDNHGASTTGPTWNFTTSSEPNNPPTTPGSPSPADGVTGVSATADLSWTGGDPDPGDTVTYDVRFGTSDPPAALLCNDVPSTTCDPGALSQGTHYYWYVVATDNHGASTTGPTWDFATVGGTTYLPLAARRYPPLPEQAYPALDACVLSAVPDASLGDTIDMWVGYDHCNSPQGVARSLIEFDLSGMPSGVAVAKATLSLYLEASCDLENRPHTVHIYRITQGWSSSSLTWNNQPSHDSGTVWASQSVSSRSWGWYTWDVTALVNGWLSGTYPNYGMMLRGPEGSGNDSAVLKFYTSNASGTTYDPRIVFSWTGGAGTGEIRSGESARPVAETLTIQDLLGKLAAGPGHAPFEPQAEETSSID